jgi:hypothetical protein
MGGRATIDQLIDVTYSKEHVATKPLVTRDDSLIMVRGWAMDAHEAAPVLAVAYVFNGQHPMRAIYGFPRPDLERHYNLRAARNCEFRLYLPALSLKSGLNELEILVIEANQSLYKQACGIQFHIAKVPGVEQMREMSAAC